MSRTTDKYVKVKKAPETAPENEVKIKAASQIGKYISYAASLLLEKKLDTVLIKASGNAARSACQIAEILRHRIVGLHQLNNLKTISVVDEYEPREEGLDRVVVERKLAVLEIALSLKDSIFDTKAAGYQPPLPKEEVQEEDLKNILAGRRGGDRGGPRGGRRGGRGGYRGDREERGDRGDRYNDRGDRGDRYNDRGDRGDRYNDRGDRYNDRGDRGDRGDRYNDRGDRGDRGDDRGGRGFRRGRYAGPRGRGGYRGGEGRGGRGGYRGESRGGYRGESRGGYRGESRGGQWE